MMSFPLNQKGHPAGQQIFSQLFCCRAFAVYYYSYMLDASPCKKLCRWEIRASLCNHFVCPGGAIFYCVLAANI